MTRITSHEVPSCRGAATPDGAEDLVEVTGLAGSQPVLVPRSWVEATVAQARETNPARVTLAPCHPDTGALTDPDTIGLREDGVSDPIDAGEEPRATTGPGSYRPGARLARQVRARDRRCRFPGCTVAAVFCDLDHVRPWPTGPTTSTNLICLCRRHHRIKQRPGWRLTLHPDATTTWTDPTGRTRTTTPVDALTPVVLPDPTSTTSQASTASQASPDNPVPPQSHARVVLHDGPHSDLEFTLQHLTAGHPWTSTTAWRDHHGPHRLELQPVTDVLVDEPDLDGDPGPDPGDRTHPHDHGDRPRHPHDTTWPHVRHRRTRSRRNHDHDDPPPF